MPGESAAEASFRLTPLGVISGRTLTPEGDPISHVTVEAAQYSYSTGRKRLERKRSVITDDRGEYRLFDLPPGRYYVRPYWDVGVARAAPPGAFAQTWFPSAQRIADAVEVDVAAGGELKGAQIHMRPEALYTLRGKMGNGPDISNPQRFFAGGRGGSVQGPGIPFPIVQRRGGDSGAMSGFSLQVVNGVWEMRNLLPGSYVVTSQTTDPEKPERRLYARQYVEIVDRDPETFTLVFQPGLDVTGTVEGSGARTAIRVRLEPEEPGPRGVLGAGVNPDGSFLFPDVPPDVYQVRVSLPQGLYLKSMRIGGREIPSQQADLTRAAAPLAIGVGDDGGRMDGQVRDAQGEALPGATVALAPHDGWPDRVQVTRSGADGAYSFRDIAPGEYQVFVWERAEIEAARDAEFRRAFERWAIPVKVEREGSSTVPLTVR